MIRRTPYGKDYDDRDCVGLSDALRPLGRSASIRMGDSAELQLVRRCARSYPSAAAAAPGLSDAQLAAGLHLLAVPTEKGQRSRRSVRSAATERMPG